MPDLLRSQLGPALRNEHAHIVAIEQDLVNLCCLLVAI